ncbi:IclR family transcriptional regulator [Caproiciproducens faecalis]|nr:IclR family transcriptional regulator [Caproiciproducens faecalis]
MEYNMKQFIESLGRYSSLKAVQILIAILNQGEIGINEICQLTDLKKSTVFRILQEMVESNLLTKNEETKQYSLGIHAIDALHIKRLDDVLVDLAGPEMKKLSDLSKETIHLMAPDSDEVTYIAKVDAQNEIQLKSKVGWHIPMYCTSAGKIFLAYKSHEELMQYLRTHDLRKRTEHTITDVDQLSAELELVREQGYALDRQEHVPDVVCIGAPIFNQEGAVVGTISISAPEYRFSLEKAISFSEEVKKSAATITGYLQDKNS